MFNKKSTLSITAIIITVTGGIWAAQIRSDTKPGALLSAANADTVELGQKIYAANCASCHGVDLKGDADWRSPDTEGFMPAPPHNKSGHTWHHTDDLLFEITKYGLAKIIGQKDYKTKMPIYEDILSDEEIIAALSYIKSTWPENIRQRHDKMNEQKAKAKN